MKLPKSFTKVTTFSKWLALSLLIIIPILTFFYGRYYEQVTKAPQATPETLMSIFRHGGMCPTGECTSQTFIYKDGSIVEDGKTIKQLPIDQVKQLQNRFITTNFAHIRDFRFTGTCPTAYDGQEVVYTFYLPDRSETFESCGYDLSESGIFAFVDALLKDEDTLCAGPKNIQCDQGYWCSYEGEASLRTIGGTCIKSQPPRRSGEGETCNGIAALQCKTGYVCYMPPGSEKIADASGTCVKAAEPTEKTIYCPQDIKMCPDGKTSIRRKPPTCAFEPCP